LILDTTSNLKDLYLERKWSLLSVLLWFTVAAYLDQPLLIFAASVFLFISPWLVNFQTSLAISRGLISLFTLYLLLLTISALVSDSNALRAVSSLVYVLGSLLFLRIGDGQVSTSLMKFNPIIFLGAFLLSMLILIGDVIAKGNLSWAMAGDSRNHVHWVKTLIVIDHSVRFGISK
jgi:hypothetical protein